MKQWSNVQVVMSSESAAIEWEQLSLHADEAVTRSGSVNGAAIGLTTVREDVRCRSLQ
jgi:hypothetical protein